MTISKIVLTLGIVFTGIFFYDYLDVILNMGRLPGVAFTSGLANLFLLLAIYCLIEEKSNRK